MNEPVVRISQGFFDPSLLERVKRELDRSSASLVPAIRKLDGLLHFYASIDAESSSMVNVSIWASLDKARQMDTLPEMLALRDVFAGAGVDFQPIRNYTGVWSILP